MKNSKNDRIHSKDRKLISVYTVFDPADVTTPVVGVVREVLPRTRRIALAVSAGLVTAAVVGLASGIAGHWG
ncbi:MAG: hypothetical protein ACYYNF_01945 [Actinomycetes bacterium]